MDKLLVAVFTAAAACLGAPAAHAQPIATQPAMPQQMAAPPRDPTINRHLGFFLRPDLGVGFMTTSEPTGTSSGNLTVSGPAGVFGFVVGGAVAENIILGAHIYDGVVANPTVSLSSGQSGTTSNASLALYGIGPEFTYYWMPSNIYFSATIALTQMSLTANGNSNSSQVGLGSRLAVGKEWWVSDHWGLGLAGHVSSSWNQDSGSVSAPMLTTWALALAFSATYN
jgi:hypothetical protein